MSDILIRGMDMPKRGHTVTITIVGSGQAYVEYYDCRPHVEETIEYEAIPVPPHHGRLIDADALRQDWLENGENEYVYDTNAFLDSLDTAPAIIPADGEEARP